MIRIALLCFLLSLNVLLCQFSFPASPDDPGEIFPEGDSSIVRSFVTDRNFFFRGRFSKEFYFQIGRYFPEGGSRGEEPSYLVFLPPVDTGASMYCHTHSLFVQHLTFRTETALGTRFTRAVLFHVVVTGPSASALFVNFSCSPTLVL